ncbi:probable membrane protein NMA1128 [hydrothermal vent metagenome]|uniref:Probable membrane protein NMA1128 n=1 Tax=hydrothermal vent metagenome TaxID=652676 RepID=A0A3B0QMA9_9ZZZZ
MDIFLVIVAALFMLLGIIGSMLPILPGPLTSWIGLLLFHLTDAVPMNWTFLGITLAIAILVWLLDYIVPALGTKKFGGSKAGMVGTTIGLLVAIFFPIFGVFGIIVWPFIGAYVGELLNKSNSDRALKAAFGSFLGFLTSTFIKFVVAVIYLGLFIVKFWDYKSVLF